MEPTEIICLGCAELFPDDYTKTEFLCPKCGHSVPQDTYLELLNFSKYVVYYGVDYRMAFESQLSDKDEIDTNYALADPASVFVFIGLAALSGIVGGASYDVVKKVISKVLMKGKEESEYPHIDEKMIKKHMQYIYDFVSGLENVDDAVKKEILHEMQMWKLTYITMPKLDMKEFPNKMDMDKFVEELRNAAKESEVELSEVPAESAYKVVKNYPSPEKFSGLWVNL